MSFAFKDSSAAVKMTHMLGVFFRRMITYCIGFCLMDCGPLASGIAYNGKNEIGVSRFDRV